jgi:hypothetical protein
MPLKMSHHNFVNFTVDVALLSQFSLAIKHCIRLSSCIVVSSSFLKNILCLCNINDSLGLPNSLNLSSAVCISAVEVLEVIIWNGVIGFVKSTASTVSNIVSSLTA